MGFIGIEGRARALIRLGVRFHQSRSGNIAIIFALSLIPLLVAVGGAIDFSRAMLAEQRLAAALDATALAVGANETASEEELLQLAQDFFNANYPDELIGTPGQITLTIEDGIVNISGTTAVDTTLLGLIDMDVLQVAAESQVVRESKSLEVVLVLDNTGSMAGSKIAALRTASDTLVDILFGNEEVHPKLRIGLVPFSQAVNVGNWNDDAFWIDTAARSSIHGQNFDPTSGKPTRILWLYDQLTNKAWNGCVESRPQPLDENDTPPSVANGDTLWVPYFYPDEPGTKTQASNGYFHSYLNDPSGVSDNPTKQKNVTKYKNASVSGVGPNRGCDIAPITPLTNVKDDLHDAIDDFVASGFTHIPEGLAWGWRVISPTEPFTEGAPYDDPETNKAIILLTDGENTIGPIGSLSSSNHNRSEYSAYGYVARGRLGTTSYSTAVSRLDPKTARICENIKAAGIRLYTITFQLPNGPIKTLMRNCATEPALYFDSPSNAELQTVFRTIARDLSNLRISR